MKLFLTNCCGLLFDLHTLLVLTKRMTTDPDGVREVHVRFDRQRGVLHLHQFAEYHRQLNHLAEIDQRSVDPVWKSSVEQDQILEMNPTEKDTITEHTTHDRQKYQKMKT